jgi:hypothetical protein
MSKDMKKEVPSILIDGSKDLVQRPVDVRDVDVEVSLGEPFDFWVDEHYSNMDSEIRSRGGQIGFELDEYRTYVRTLIASRVAYVRRERYIIHPTTRVAVPTLVSAVLSSLGVVHDDEHGLTFIPKLSLPGELMTDDDMRRISNKLEVLSHFGFVFAMGYERDRRGMYDLMVMQYLLDGDQGPGVYSHTRSPHPGFSMVAYFLQLKQLQDLLGARISYGNRETMRSHLRGLAVA